MLAILAACVSMAFRDGLATILVVAEARGRSVLAGMMDALGDLAGFAVTILGAGEVIAHGINGYTLTLLGCMIVTSFFGTIFWTKLSRRIGEAKPDEKKGS